MQDQQSLCDLFAFHALLQGKMLSRLEVISAVSLTLVYRKAGMNVVFKAQSYGLATVHCVKL
jgi:hypothetical protein